MTKTTYETINYDEMLPVKLIHFNEDLLKLQFPSIDFSTVNFIPLHWHRSIEFSYVKKGKLVLRTSSSTKEINEGEFLIVNHNELHEIHNVPSKETDVICCIISYDFIKSIIPTIDDIYFVLDSSHASYSKFSEMFETISDLYFESGKYNYLKITAILYTMFYELLSYHSTLRVVQYDVDQQLIKDMINYIHDNYSSEITLQDISAHFGFSREHFSRLFKSKLNISFYSYLTNYRLFQAMPDVSDSNKTIESIALSHGFPNTKSFIEAFKKSYNTTPLEFRKNHEISIIDHNSVF